MGPGMNGKEQVSESFVARIWLESGSNGDAVWRGHIRHVQGDQETYFQDLGKMSDFLEQMSGVTGPKLIARTSDDDTKSGPGTVTSMKRKD